jgi:hypothetical protein
LIGKGEQFGPFVSRTLYERLGIPSVEREESLILDDIIQ